MADIAQLLANAADTKADFNFGKLADSYWAGLENAYKQRTRDAFQDPGLYDASGNLNAEKAIQQSLRVGGLAGVEPASKIADFGYTGQQRAALSDYLKGLNGGQPSIVSPPSITQSGAREAVQPDLTQRGSSAAAAPQPQQGGGGTVADILTANGIPNSEIGNVSRSLGVDPARPVGLSDPLRQPLIAAIGQFKNNGIGQTYAPGQATPAPQVVQPINPQVAQGSGAPPQVAPQPSLPQQPPVSPQRVQGAPMPMPDQSVGGLISPELLRLGRGTTQGALAILDQMALRAPKEQRPAFEAQAAAIRKQLEYTSEQKNAIGAGRTPRQQQEFDARTNEEKLAAATGQSVKEVMDRAEEAKATQSVLEKTMPVIVDSYKEASGAVNSIRATHQAREALDASGGILSGKWADAKIDALRIAALVGADTSKIVNTETFNSQMAARLLEKVKSLPGPASDKDIKFLNGAVGSPILQEATLRRMLDISEDADRRKIDTHNNLLGRASKSSDAIKNVQPTFGVDAPGAYQRKLQEGMTIRNPKTGQVKQVKNGQLVDVK